MHGFKMGNGLKCLEIEIFKVIYRLHKWTYKWSISGQTGLKQPNGEEMMAEVLFLGA